MECPTTACPSQSRTEPGGESHHACMSKVPRRLQVSQCCRMRGCANWFHGGGQNNLFQSCFGGCNYFVEGTRGRYLYCWRNVLHRGVPIRWCREWSHGLGPLSNVTGPKATSLREVVFFAPYFPRSGETTLGFLTPATNILEPNIVGDRISKERRDGEVDVDLVFKPALNRVESLLQRNFIQGKTQANGASGEVSVVHGPL